MESLSKIFESLGAKEYGIALSLITALVWKCRKTIKKVWKGIFKPKPPPSPPMTLNITNCNNVTINMGNENKTAITLPPKVEGAGKEEKVMLNT